MKALANSILLGFFLVSLAATTQPTAPTKVDALPAPTPPQKRGDRPSAPGASAQALAGTASPPVASVPVFNTPQHLPDQIDFGTVPSGSSATRTFSLITNAPGYVAVAVPGGPFRVAEFREMGPPAGSRKNSGAQALAGGAGSIRSRIKYQEGQSGPYQWSMAPNMEIQVDLVFAPMLKRGETPGPRSATMKVSGPGPRGNWSLAIPLTGVLSNLVLTPAPPTQKFASQTASSSKMTSAKGSGVQNEGEEH